MSLLANGGKLGEIFKRLSSKLKTRPNLPVSLFENPKILYKI